MCILRHDLDRNQTVVFGACHVVAELILRGIGKKDDDDDEDDDDEQDVLTVKMNTECTSQSSIEVHRI
jgi:hypothetical protein